MADDYELIMTEIRRVRDQRQGVVTAARGATRPEYTAPEALALAVKALDGLLATLPTITGR